MRKISSQGIGHKKPIKRTTLGNVFNLRDLDRKIYDKDEIKEFDLYESINSHPLSHRPTSIRSKLAYQDLLKVCKPTRNYLLPGQLVLFHYANPKYKEELEYYDASPLTLFCGITRTKDGNIREVGINLHYFPPFTRYKVIDAVYRHFKPYFEKSFNEPTGKPNTWISFDAVRHLAKSNAKIGFAVKMYIPVLRGKSYVLPTRLVPTACYTEGHFSKATMQQIFKFWRQF